MLKPFPETVTETKQNSTSQKQQLNVPLEVQASEAPSIIKIKAVLLSDEQQNQQIQGTIETQNISTALDNNEETSRSLPVQDETIISKSNQQEVGVDESQNNQLGYADLTTKLQSALNKISSQKKGQPKTKEANQDFIDRFQKCSTKKKQDMKQKKQEIEMYKTKQVKQKPTIDKRSDKMMKQIGYEPIYTRFQKIVETRKKKVEQLEETKRKKDEQDQALFIEEYNKHMKKPETRRTYDQYYNEMQRWKQKTQIENKQKLELKKSKQMEGLTFKPIINSKSQKMISNKQRLPIDQRGLPKKKTPSTDFTFSPKINTKKSTKVP